MSADPSKPLLLPWLLIVLVTAQLAACQGPRSSPQDTPAAPQATVTRITLNQPFDIRPNRASEYIQDGEIRSFSRISEYYPHCIFELRTVSGNARVVEPDEFVITRIQRDPVWAGYRRILLASGDGDGGAILSKTHYHLESDKQPDVFRLTCQQLNDPFFSEEFVTVAEMQQTLGELFTLTLAP